MIAMERMERITSRQNAVVKRFRDLVRPPGISAPSKRAERPGAGASAGEILLDGEHLLQEALACDIPVELAVFLDRQVGNARSPLGRLAADVQIRGGRALAVNDQVLAAISPVQHPSGVVAIGRARAADVRGVMAAARGAGPHLPLVVVVAGVQDPGNVGAIVRAAAAFGAAGVVAIEGSANPFGWKALRGAMGATFRVSIAARGSAADVIAAAQEEGVRIVAAVPRQGTPVSRVDYGVPTALVLGGEGAGVSGTLMAAAHERLSIPMRAPIEALNVAAAAAIVLYEAARQSGS
jgi:TrmH family RNA methyltransferase